MINKQKAEDKMLATGALTMNVTHITQDGGHKG